jgi:hypothetical protein
MNTLDVLIGEQGRAGVNQERHASKKYPSYFAARQFGENEAGHAALPFKFLALQAASTRQQYLSTHCVSCALPMFSSAETPRHL